MEWKKKKTWCLLEYHRRGRSSSVTHLRTHFVHCGESRQQFQWALHTHMHTILQLQMIKITKVAKTWLKQLSFTFQHHLKKKTWSISHSGSCNDSKLRRKNELFDKFRSEGWMKKKAEESTCKYCIHAYALSCAWRLLSVCCPLEPLSRIRWVHLTEQEVISPTSRPSQQIKGYWQSEEEAPSTC